MTSYKAPSVILANGVEIPQLGLGTWPMNDAETTQAVSTAIELGYRMIDTAENYENEKGVGQGIKNASIPRDEIFITTKFNRQWHSFDGAQKACEASLKRLQVDYIDLLLIHWPNPDQDSFVDAFLGLTKLLDQGKVRAIGTSNFKPAHLQRLFKIGLAPHLNQIQMDPYHRRDDLVEIHKQNNIITESWRPLGCGNGMLQDPLIVEIARQKGRTAAQIVLRWAIQQGICTAAKSSNPNRMQENLNVFDFELSTDEMTILNTLNPEGQEIVDADSFGH